MIESVVSIPIVVAREKLTRDGYGRHSGQYFGVGAPLYYFYSPNYGVEFEGYIRSGDIRGCYSHPNRTKELLL